MKLAKKDIRHLEWIYDRMKSVHNENENFDYMLAFRRIIDGLYKEYEDYHTPQQPDLPAENTVMWWLCRIADDEVRRKAVVNAIEWGYQGLVNEFRDAMWAAFLWQNTEEGYEFWDKVDQEQSPLLPSPEWKEYLELRK